MPNVPKALDAGSFANLVCDPEAKGPDAAFAEYALRSGMPRYMVRTRRHKLVYNEGATHEMYDHERDPEENVNRIDEPGYAATRKDLLDRLMGWYDPGTNPWKKS